MTDLTTYPMPSVRFRSRTPLAAPTLPAMDVAGFVGLAPTGPIDVPVRIESKQELDDVLGTEDQAALVGPVPQLRHSVNAFFANGGSRCWVVRVDPAPRSRVFPLPTVLLGPPRSSQLRQATVRSRAPGPLADHHQLVAEIDLVDVGAFSVTTGSAVTIDGAADVEAGDLIMVDPATGASELAAVAGVSQERGHRELILDRRRLSLVARPLIPAELRGQPTQIIGPRGATSVVAAPDPDNPRAATIECTVGGTVDIGPGSVLRWGQRHGRARFVVVRSARRLSRTGYYVVLSADSLEVGEASGPPPSRGRLVRADLLLREKSHGPTARLSFGPPVDDEPLVERQRRRPSWSSVPDDETLYRAILEEDLHQLRSVERPGLRLPFAGPEAAMDTAAWPLLWPQPVVDGVTALAVSTEPPPLPADEAHLLFVDRRLDGSPLYRLEGELAHYELHRNTQPLRGLHALAPIEEITMLACPDAVAEHTPPERPEPCRPPCLRRADRETMTIEGTKSDEGVDDLELEVGSEPGLEGAAKLLLDGPRAMLRIAELSALPDPCAPTRFARARQHCADGLSPWSQTLVLADSFTECGLPLPAPIFEVEPVGSTTVRVTVARPVAPPPDASSTLKVTVELSSSPSFASQTTISRTSGLAALNGAVLVFNRATLGPGWLFARARYHNGDGTDGTLGPWSTTSRVAPLPTSGPPVVVPADRSDLLRVQLAMIRLCAARRDAVAILTMPQRWEADRVADHLAVLRTPGQPAGTGDTPPPALERSEAHALSFATTAHPWLGVLPPPRAEPVGDTAALDDTVWASPDGWVCGVMARTARERGAWQAPARARFHQVSALARFDGDDGRLRAAGLNRISAEAPDVFLLTADTLLPWNLDNEGNQRSLGPGASRPVVSDLNVRLLVILVRRLALQVGRPAVFEPINDGLRSHVHGRLSRAMQMMFERGAFAGRTPREAYRVSIPDRLNDRIQAERGRFYVELDIAPSRPLEMLTVELLLNQPAGVSQQGPRPGARP